MDNPEYHVGQFARSHGLSKIMSLRVTLLVAYAREGKTLQQAATLVGIARSTAQSVARKMIIDFPDYRPYAALEKKGEARPDPYFREDNPATSLPLFS